MIQGLILDLDGTLTRPGLIDFAAMRRAIGCPEGETILEHLDQLRAADPEGWARALAEVDRQEREAARNVLPAHNLEPFMAWMDRCGLPRAIITRNSRATTALTLERLGLAGRFDPIVAREDAPPKPAPDGVWMIAAAWGLPVRHTVVIGDFRHDIEAGARAGAHTILYTGGRPLPVPPEAEHVVHDLMELPALIDRMRGG